MPYTAPHTPGIVAASRLAKKSRRMRCTGSLILPVPEVFP
jgi:hypothetical protein